MTRELSGGNKNLIEKRSFTHVSGRSVSGLFHPILQKILSAAASTYSGRIALHELLEGNEKIRRLILKQASVEEVRETAMESGMATLKQDGLYKIFNGDCDLKQVLTICLS